jgi:hypothetical protein
MSSKKSKKTTAPKTKSSQAKGPSSRKSSARSYSASKTVVNQRLARVIAGALAAFFIIGAVALVISLDGQYGLNHSITIALLGFFAGLSLFAAVRTEAAVAFFQRISKR